jgi:4-amino-4-deoxy-L-arabinose transferase-like glycosyltransferase
MSAGFFALAANAAWVITERRGQPLNIDEAGYASMAYIDYFGVRSGGIAGWWHQVISQPVQAPLAPALASALDWATGPRVLNVFAVSLLAYGVLLLATLGLTKGWPWWSRGMALFFVGASPVLLDFSRSFEFAELASACLAAALYFGHRSKCFTRTVPALAWGACLGLMLLARTMTVAFVPGLVVAALVPVFARKSARGLLRVLAGLVVGTAVAATWYVHNFESVYTYLTSYGYGAQAASYGAQRSLLSAHDWYFFLLGQANGYFYAGVAAFLMVGWLAAAGVVAGRCLRARSRGWGVRPLLHQVRARLAMAPVVLSCVIVAAAGTLTLMSSRNNGSGFVAPLVVPLVVVASWGISALGAAVLAHRRTTLGIALAVPAAVILLLASVSAALTFLPMPVQVAAVLPVPGTATLVLWESAGTLRTYEDGGGVPISVEPDPGAKATGRAWLAASAFADAAIRQASSASGRVPLAVFTFNERMLNVNTVELDSLVRYRSALAQFLLEPLSRNASVADYLRQASAIDPSVTAVATVTTNTDEFEPQVPLGVGVDYARSLQFRPFARYWLPDGQWLVLWDRAGSPDVQRSPTT